MKLITALLTYADLPADWQESYKDSIDDGFFMYPDSYGKEDFYMLSEYIELDDPDEIGAIMIQEYAPPILQVDYESSQITLWSER